LWATVAGVIPIDWSDVTKRVAALAAHPNAGEVFGSGTHQWKLEPPLTSEEINDLQAQVKVELPEEYRSFLLQVSRGGAGPSYGLFPARRVDGSWRWDGDGAEITDLQTLAQPFAHTEAFDPVDALPGPPVADDFASAAKFTEAEDAYWQQRDTVMFAAEHTIGLLYLCHLGCAIREVLVVSGPARGQMWVDDTASDGGFEPLLEENGDRLGFAGWYRRWLQQTETQLHGGAAPTADVAPLPE
jgi:hypothetical protein